MAVYLIRHGESEGNLAKFFQGRLDTRLTERGAMQAQTVGQWLKRQAVQPTTAYSSPLMRAQVTANTITSILGCPAPSVLPELIEFSAGKLEGLTQEEIAQEFPGYDARPLGERDDYSEFGGESYEAVQERLGHFIELAQPQAVNGKNVLVVSHGGALYQLLKLWCSWPTPRHFFQHIGNCTCYKLVIKEVAGRQAGVLEWMVPIELMG